VISGDLSDAGYDFSQRAYFLKSTDPENRGAELELAAGPESPLMNACLVIEGWGDSTPQVAIDGTGLSRGSDYELGYSRTLEGTDLLIWIAWEAREPVRITLSRTGE
jgi:hypothetical protein